MRLLACDFRLVTDCREFVVALDGLVQHATQNYPVSRVHRFEAWRTDERYHLREDGRDLESPTGAWHAASTLFWRMHDLALDALPEFTKVHAGCASWNNRRFVAVGPTHSGKTTLMTRLLYDGFAVHCDDIVLVRRGEVLPYPRRFRLRPPAVALLPEIGSMAMAITDDPSSPGLDPSEQGFRWEIDLAPADAVIFLQPDRSGPTRLEVSPKYQMAERVMSQSQPPAGGAEEWIKDICALLDGSDCYVLTASDLACTVGMLKDALRP